MKVINYEDMIMKRAIKGSFKIKVNDKLFLLDRQYFTQLNILECKKHI